MDNSKINIAIDGQSACGKSTLAKGLASALGYKYIDSGAMYRAVTLYLIENHINPESPEELQKALDQIEIQVNNHNEDSPSAHITMNGHPVDEQIRELKVSNMVSQVAAIPAVRKKLVEIQKNIGHQKGVVMDGRDIGTVVFPDAELKIYLKADHQTRVERRLLELQNAGKTVTLDEIDENLKYRDYIDSHRLDSPLRKAEDAIELDNTDLNQEQQLNLALSWAIQRINNLKPNND